LGKVCPLQPLYGNPAALLLEQRYDARGEPTEEFEDTKYTPQQEKGALPQLLDYWKSPVY